MAKRKERRVGEAQAAYGTNVGRRAQRRPNEMAGWEWVEANEDSLEEQYADRWIAVADCRVVGSGVRLATALRQAKAKGYDHPFVTAFRPKQLQNAVIIGCWR